jgi:hypothetical protein
MQNTQDLSKFGIRELKIARDLLSAYLENPDILGNGVAIEFNPNSGCVFLVDEDYDVAMMNGEKLENWLDCPNCGNEGFYNDIKDNSNPCCVEYLKQFKGEE